MTVHWETSVLDDNLLVQVCGLTASITAASFSHRLVVDLVLVSYAAILRELMGDYHN